MIENMKYVILFAVLGGSVSVLAGHTAGLCENKAIQQALKSAPGIDPGSPATVTAFKLVKVEKLDAKARLEKYYVQTEDQGGTAASVISIKVTDKSSLRNEFLSIDCKVVDQKWVE